MYYSYLLASQLKRLFSPFMPSEHYSLGLFSLQKFLQMNWSLPVGSGYEMAKSNLDLKSGHNGLAGATSSGVLRQLDEATKTISQLNVKRNKDYKLKKKN